MLTEHSVATVVNDGMPLPGDTISATISFANKVADTSATRQGATLFT